ncbi:MAG: low specificity L-threonine aldolase [Actinobacteria bacterium]|nr:low specificity L-threonine aldolase [Actinomycetota bacterium]
MDPRRLLPPPPDQSFASDNAAGVSPEVMDALAASNAGSALAYGDDQWTRRAEELLREAFDAPVRSYHCWGGTGANVVGLASILRPWQAVICADTAHIVVDECGAPARFSGATVIPVGTDDGKLTPEHLAPWLAWQGVEHHPQPAVVSITQSTEMGTLYSVEEIGTICDAAHRNGMLVHLDGARIANALVATGADLATMVRDTGVDVMTLGLTKDGAMFGETVVFVRPELDADARFVRKQAGQLVSKSRFVAVQVVALLADDLWLRNARHANEMASSLAEELAGTPGVTIDRAPEVNSVFARVPVAKTEQLQDWSFFWTWDRSAGLVRWMTSFATGRSDVERFADGIRAILAMGGPIASLP